jgi:hypothetical protein
VEVAFEHLDGKRVLDALLDDAFQRPGSVRGEYTRITDCMKD